MKRTTAIPKGTRETVVLPLSLLHKPQSALYPPAVYASPLRCRARQVLDLPKAGNRLQLILGLMVVIGLGLAVPMILDCLLLLAELLPYLSEGASVLWLLVLYGVLFGGVLIFFTLPLACAVYRMAVLMTEVHRRTEAGLPPETVGVFECLYPFTSAKAYGRTLYVGARALGSLLLTLAPSVAVILVAAWWIPLVSGAVPPIVYVLLWVAHIAVACLALVGMLIWSARGWGFGYLVFSRPEVPIRQVREVFRGYRRNVGLPLWLMLSFSGWIAVSCLAVFIPFLLHTVPYMLLSWASYGRYLADIHVSVGVEPVFPHPIEEVELRVGTAEALSPEIHVTEAS